VLVVSSCRRVEGIEPGETLHFSFEAARFNGHVESTGQRVNKTALFFLGDAGACKYVCRWDRLDANGEGGA
jgi:hypothetical protein